MTRPTPHSYPAALNPCAMSAPSDGGTQPNPVAGASFFNRADRPTDARAGGGTCGDYPLFSMGLASLQLLAHVSLREAV